MAADTRLRTRAQPEHRLRADLREAHLAAALSEQAPDDLDIPLEMQWEAVNIPDPGNPVGAKGVGEVAALGRQRRGAVRDSERRLGFAVCCARR
jgi:hypothetical protein